MDGRSAFVHRPTGFSSQPPDFSPKPPRRFQELVLEACPLRHFSIRTEEAYWMWTRRFILFHGKRHPREMGAAEITEFITDLAVQREVAPSTQMQALNALVFIYKHVLGREPGDFSGV